MKKFEVPVAKIIEEEEKLKGEGYSLGTRLQIGSAIGAHVGPGAYGVLFVEK